MLGFCGWWDFSIWIGTRLRMEYIIRLGRGQVRIQHGRQNTVDSCCVQNVRIFSCYMYSNLPYL